MEAAQALGLFLHWEWPSCPGNSLCGDTMAQGLPSQSRCFRSCINISCAQVHATQSEATQGSSGTSVSACFYFKACRQLRPNVWCQYFFSFFFSTVHAILRNSQACGGGVRRLWNLSSCGNNLFFLWRLCSAVLGLGSAADAAWIASSLGAHTLDSLETK